MEGSSSCSKNSSKEQFKKTTDYFRTRHTKYKKRFKEKKISGAKFLHVWSQRNLLEDWQRTDFKQPKANGACTMNLVPFGTTIYMYSWNNNQGY